MTFKEALAYTVDSLMASVSAMTGRRRQEAPDPRLLAMLLRSRHRARLFRSFYIKDRKVRRSCKELKWVSAQNAMLGLESPLPHRLNSTHIQHVLVVIVCPVCPH